MPIELFTGLPGHGKTSLMMERLLKEAAEGKRPLYVCGVEGLQPGLAKEFNVRQWNAFTVNPDGACHCDASQVKDREGNVIDHPRHDHTEVEDGALCFVDEAWKDFGHLHDASRQPTPRHVLDLAVHRHRGIDFVWTTQAPNQIYPHARGLIEGHTHVVRKYGTQFIECFTWGELNEDVKSIARRESSLRKTRSLPTKTRELYKSASVHTIKARIPFRIFALPVILVAAICLGLFAYHRLKPSSMAANLTGKEPSAASAAPASDDEGAHTRTVKYSTPEEYAKAFTARIPTIPWTAPAYDGRQVVSDPRVFCSYSGAGLDGQGEYKDESCHCMTEQGTPYNLAREECKTLAYRGEPYNPFKPPQQEQQAQLRDTTGEGRSPSENASSRHASGQRYGSGAQYGGMGI